jgi:hypothetical protein
VLLKVIEKSIHNDPAIEIAFSCLAAVFPVHLPEFSGFLQLSDGLAQSFNIPRIDDEACLMSAHKVSGLTTRE